MKTINWSVYLILIILFSCNQLAEYSTNAGRHTARKEEEVILCAPGSSSDTTGKIDGKVGHSNGTGLRSGLNIVVHGFKVIPFLDSGNWGSFIPLRDSAWVFGDVIINESDLALVHTELAAHGLTIQDAHRYGSRNGPIILFLHINGFGNRTTLANNTKTFFARLKWLSDKTDKEGKIITSETSLNNGRLDSILSYKGQVAGDVYKHIVGRPEVLRTYGIPSHTHREFNTWAVWQGTDDKAVVTGDFMIFEREVAPVAKALAENGFEIIHNHLVHEEPSIFSLHYVNFGKAEKLAQGLKAALDQQESK